MGNNTNSGVNEYGISNEAMRKLYKLMGDIHTLLKRKGGVKVALF